MSSSSSSSSSSTTDIHRRSSDDDDETAAPSPATLVWVTVGKTQHPALLLKRASSSSASGEPLCRCWVEWTSTQQREWVDGRQVEDNLSPRNRRRRSSVASAPQAAAASARSPRPTKRPRAGGSNSQDSLLVMSTMSAASSAATSTHQTRSSAEKSSTGQSDAQLKTEERETGEHRNRRSDLSIVVGKENNDQINGGPDSDSDDDDDSDNVLLVDLMEQSEDDDEDDKSDDSDYLPLVSLVSSKNKSSRRPPPATSNHRANDNSLSTAHPAERPRAVSRSPPTNEACVAARQFTAADSSLEAGPVEQVLIVRKKKSCPSSTVSGGSSLSVTSSTVDDVDALKSTTHSIKSTTSMDSYKHCAAKRPPEPHQLLEHAVSFDVNPRAIIPWTDARQTSKPASTEGAAQATSSDAETTASQAKNDATTKTKPKYPLRTSAYLQNLAEISFTILKDRRWRVAETPNVSAAGGRLFQWEAGEDLSVVSALSRQFVPRPPPQQLPCTCLLCRDRIPKKDPPPPQQQQQQHDEHDNFNASDDTPVGNDGKETVDSAAKDDDDEVRGLYLYCRLFYRKGPWFRIDDVYNRYYSPKKVKNENGDPPGTVSPKEALSKEAFFEPVDASTTAATNPKAGGKSSAIIDRAQLQKHVEEYVPQLLADLDVLRRMGAVRFFNDEQECGKTVGESLLTAEERVAILSKLGAGKKKQRSKSSSATATDSKENAIWKQMCQQKSIFSAAAPTGEKTYLPVQRHVDDLLAEKLAKSIVQSCSDAEYIPAHVMRPCVQAVISSIRNSLKTGNSACDGAAVRLCFRLREGPTMTLQRCARLYLCATSGPGEMRSSATNGWRSLMVSNAASDSPPPLARAIPPPGQQTWNQVQYPGLAHGFGLSSACFMNAHQHLPADDSAGKSRKVHSFEQVFCSRSSFHCWELCAELRSNVDYLVELNEMLRYNQRRESKGKEALYKNGKTSHNGNGSVDFMNLLSEEGQKLLLNKLMVRSQSFGAIHADVQRDIQACHTNLDGECEQLLCVVGIMAAHILRIENEYIPEDELGLLANRPWLRHMSWQGCLAYILWDIIPIFERRALYRHAAMCLELLLFGYFDTDASDAAHIAAKLDLRETSALAPILLSRRARGKAIDRLIIDYNHIHRQLVSNEDKKAKKAASEAFQKRVVHFCRQVIADTAHSGSIGFSSIRTVARRLKQPLADSLHGIECPEAELLGLRFGSNVGSEPVPSKQKSKAYSDWVPITDRSVANALKNEEAGPGGRCAFVGYEDDEKPGTSSLNVEELAMKLYRSGRLPAEGDSPLSQGGWMGWHDEGGHVRALFRIVCSAPILGMDFGCAYASTSEKESLEHATVHLSPYQGAPFDLHVGFERRSTTGGFYARRANTIHLFLGKLERLSDQEISDLIYDSIASRLYYMNANNQKDPFLDRDLMQIRTLSAVGAGFGGKQLAAIFRCFFFDYRHYSGGLPDLHLFRARSYDPNSPTEDKVTPVDLGEWIGESFSVESQQALAANQAAAILWDRDDEYLGCSKVGDSGGQASRLSRNIKQLLNTANQKTDQSKIPSLDMLPERLQLMHNDRRVRVECLMVEVKSSNDRLDARQEDWLNALAKNGNARVCKFEDNSKK